MKLIVGARTTNYPGWVSTDTAGDAPLDIRKREDWQRYFQPGTIDRIVAEHVLEHLNEDDAQLALANFYLFLRPDGRLRLAVPDAYNPNPYYQEMSRPGGLFQECYSRIFHPLVFGAAHIPHEVHYNVDSLSALLAGAGFAPKPREWFDASGVFHHEPWDPADGPIYRAWGDPYNNWFALWHGYPNLSLIVDGLK